MAVSETPQHVSQTLQTGEGRLTIGAAALGLVTMLPDISQALHLDETERHIVLVGMFAQLAALTISRGLVKLGRALAVARGEPHTG